MIVLAEKFTNLKTTIFRSGHFVHLNKHFPNTELDCDFEIRYDEKYLGEGNRVLYGTTLNFNIFSGGQRADEVFFF